ncbi:MAG: hypothetical protein GXO44_03910 [Deferribacteres bacterium]|nr:hypothetical protein [Deferribacteres bacterium]
MRILRKEGVLDSKNGSLEFTGNWFIDLGILGFVNLMEEVYGWDLEQLKKKISQDENKIFCAFYPVAYLYSWIKDRNLPTEDIPNSSEIEKIVTSEIEEIVTNAECSKVFNSVWWKFIVPMFKTLWIDRK